MRYSCRRKRSQGEDSPAPTAERDLAEIRALVHQLARDRSAESTHKERSRGNLARSSRAAAGALRAQPRKQS